MAAVVDRNTSFYLYNPGYETLFFTSLIVLWSASHILEDWKGRMTWPSIILGLGIANLYTIPVILPAELARAAISALITGPLLILIGGLLSFSAVRQYSREHSHAVTGHA
ncbi:MAG TPA: hypothetical protein VNA15_01185 [Candidatus Angelobacter sp.]|nr:hypothetical protein [Candidatus Angelobacter sp.]